MATLLPEGKQSFTDSAGAPLVGGKLYTYDAGTNTPRATYTDADATVPNTNPVVLDGRGEATIFWEGVYKVVLTDANDAIIWTVDYVASVDEVGTQIREELLNTDDPAKNSGMVWFNPTLNYVVGTIGAKLGQRVSVRDFPWLAKGNGITDDSAAFQACYDWAGDHGAEVWHPPGDYLLANVDLDFVRAYSLVGPTTNSVFTRANLVQKDFNTPMFKCAAINLRVSGLCFTCFAGSSFEADGTSITVVAAGSGSMTLSGNPWKDMSPVVWTPETPYVATDGTLYPNVVRFNAMGAWVASSVVVNVNGTVTLNGVKGSDGTLDASLPGTVGSGITFVSLAHTLPDSSFTNPQAATFFMDVRENQFFDHLWFNQVGRAFSYDALGSGAGVGVGIGNAGFMNNIVVDQARRFIYAAGSINALQMGDCQMYGVRCVFEAVGSMIGCILSDTMLHTSQRFMDIGGGLVGCIVTGNMFNALTGQGYCDDLINVAGGIQDTLIGSNLFGRASNVAPVVTLGTADGLTFTGNAVISHSEGANIGFLSVTGNSFTNSLIESNNFESKFSSGARRVSFTNPSAPITGSRFGPDVEFNTNHTAIGLIAVSAFSGAWVNTGGGVKAAAYFKDQDGFVNLTGSISTGATGTAAFTLPLGYRPTALVRVPVGASTAFGYLEISSGGVVTPFFGGASSWVSLDGVSFPTV